MIPVAGAVRLGEYPVHGFRLSIPFLLLWIVLLPFLVLAVPILFIAAMCARVSPLRAVAAPVDQRARYRAWGRPRSA